MDCVLYMAPLQGVTGQIYRGIYPRFFPGYDFAVAPFIGSCSSARISRHYLRDILPEGNHPSLSLIPQILGRDAGQIATLAQAMLDLGYDTVNWNLGCPLPKVRKKRRGAGLLPYPDEIAAVLEQVLPRLSGGLSLKVRLGSEDPGELARLLPRLDGFPLTEIIIHPRTGAQMYGGAVDLDALTACLALTRHRIVYSGDVYSLADWRALRDRFPMIHRWMIGRGGVSNPFLPGEIRGEGPQGQAERRERFRAFHDALFTAYQKRLFGPSHLLAKMKELWWYWRQGVQDEGGTYDRVCRARTAAGYQRAVADFFDLDLVWRVR